MGEDGERMSDEGRGRGGGRERERKREGRGERERKITSERGDKELGGGEK